MASANGVERVVNKSSVPYSDAFPVRDEQLTPGHFRKLKLLGRGGVGKVYLVLLVGTEKLYAMKVLTKEEMIEKNKIKRVLTEREILATANHPFIVTMYASFQTTHKLYFVMDYCAGGEFFRMLQKQPRKRLDETAARFYAAEVLMALEYLHHMGFIYRDLKPENVLMRADGHLAVTDFDLSKQGTAISPRIVENHKRMTDKLREAFTRKSSLSDKMKSLQIVDSEPVLTEHSTSFVGTEEYIAPEVVEGVAQTASVDWWTLGILIYEMMTGTTPFKGDEQTDTFRNICNMDVKFPSGVDMSKDVKSLIRGLLTRDPSKRLGSKNGASDIVRHKWFTGSIDFTLIRNEDPPIVPRIRDPLDLEQYHLDEDDEIDGVVDDSLRSKDNPFGEFNVRRDMEVQKKY